MRKNTISLLVGVAALLLVTGPGLAAKPGSSFSLVVVSSGELRVAEATAEPAYGGQITFDVATTQADRPFVEVNCYQGAAWVYNAWHGFFDGYVPEPVYTLTSPYWSEGAADCTARLVEWGRNGRDRTLDTLEFHVAG